MLLGVAPIAALPLLAGGLPGGFRHQVLQMATGNSPAAVAHRAAVAKTSYSFGHQGFPRPLHQPGSPWWHARPGHAGAAVGTAAAVAAGVTWIAVPPHHGVPPAGAATPSVTGSAVPALGKDGRNGTPGPGGTAPAGATAQPSALPMASGSSAAGIPTVSMTAVPSSAGATSADPNPSPSPSASTSDEAAAGTLSVSPSTLDVTPPASGSITVTASGGPVNWSISEPAGLEQKVVIAPMSGTLAAGETATISVTVTGQGKPRVHLTFVPGGAVVTVRIG